jgi:myosin heavy subunit
MDDVSEMTSINVVDLLQNLKNRFQIHQIFTNVGKTLIIINPYNAIPAMFSSERIEEFIKVNSIKIIANNINIIP